MRCRSSKWTTKKDGWTCRTLTCPGRKVTECVSSEWWKETSIPDGTRPSDVCGGSCKEEELVIDAKDVPGAPVKKLRRKVK
jgi:hypothetical protein